MKTKLLCLFVSLNIFSFIKAQETVVLDTSMFEKNYQTIALTVIKGLIFREGNDLKWAQKNIDSTGWKKFSPNAISAKNVDENGRVEGWFRVQLKLDSSFINVPLKLHFWRWVAMDVYVDGLWVASLGNTGIDGKPYKENTTTWIHSPEIHLSFSPGTVHTLAVHFVDCVTPLNHKYLKSEINGGLGVSLAGPEMRIKTADNMQDVSIYFTLYTSVCAVLCLLFWFLYFQNKTEKGLFHIAFGMSFLFLFMGCISITSIPTEMPFIVFNIASYGGSVFSSLFMISVVFILAAVFKKKIKPVFIPLLFIMAIFPVVEFYTPVPYADYAILLITLATYLYLIISSLKNLRGAQWAVLAGIVFTFILFIALGYQDNRYNGVWPFPFCYALMGGGMLSFPLSLMVYVAMRFKEILKDVQTNAKQVVQLSEEKKDQAIQQQKVLEEEVAKQTIDLRTSLENLKSTQAQLIQSEKMASLGELTAGIAHEIQNPLNFVNNFSDLNKELIAELKDELKAGNLEEVEAIATDIESNEGKISHHGKRAEAIVTGMLQHSRTSTGQKELTDINKLADEYLRLSYHGVRAKDKTFNCDIITEFDESIGKVNIVPQDIGRVILNLVGNAFYAVNEKSKSASQDYKPAITVSTKKSADRIELLVTDNGNGIPDKTKDKIFNPFFTTKPTGQGTGLGLSLSYDIVKAHGGAITVDTKEGEGTTFTIMI